MTWLGRPKQVFYRCLWMRCILDTPRCQRMYAGKIEILQHVFDEDSHGSWRTSRQALILMSVLGLRVLSACTATPTVEPPLIARKPKPTPLPAAILQIKSQPSTDSLQKASVWSQASEATLSDETPK